MTDWLRTLPGETRCSLIVGHGEFTVDELREAFASDGPIYLTTAQASERYGWSREYWADAAKDMDGAVKGREWHLPADAVEAHVRAKSENGRPRRRRAPAPSQARRARPQGLQER